MSETIVKWRTVRWNETRIERVEFISETAHYLLDGRGRRTAKRSDHDNYFDSWSDAREFMLDQKRRVVDRLRFSLASEECALAKIEAMTEPQTETGT